MQVQPARFEMKGERYQPAAKPTSKKGRKVRLCAKVQHCWVQKYNLLSTDWKVMHVRRAAFVSHFAFKSGADYYFACLHVCHWRSA
jgi:hypothetical protein